MICTSIHCDSGLIGAFGLLTFTCDSETTCSRDMLSESVWWLNSALSISTTLFCANHALSKGCNHKQTRKIERSWKTVAKCDLYDLYFLNLHCHNWNIRLITTSSTLNPWKKKWLLVCLSWSWFLWDKSPNLLFFSVEIASSSAAWIGQEEFFLFMPSYYADWGLNFVSRWRTFCPTHFSKMSISRLLFPHLARGLFLKNSAMRLHGRCLLGRLFLHENLQFAFGHGLVSFRRCFWCPKNKTELRNYRKSRVIVELYRTPSSFWM